MRVQSFSSPDCSLAGVTSPLFWFPGRILVGRLSENRPSQGLGFSVYVFLLWLFSLVVCSQGVSVYSSPDNSNVPSQRLKLVIAPPDLQNPLNNHDTKRSFRCPAFRASRALSEVSVFVKTRTQINQIALLFRC